MYTQKEGERREERRDKEGRGREGGGGNPPFTREQLFWSGSCLNKHSKSLKSLLSICDISAGTEANSQEHFFPFKTHFGSRFMDFSEVFYLSPSFVLIHSVKVPSTLLLASISIWIILTASRGLTPVPVYCTCGGLDCIEWLQFPLAELFANLV